MVTYTWGTVGSGKTLRLLSNYYLEKTKSDNTYLVKLDTDTRTKGIFTRFGNVEVDADLIITKDISSIFELLARQEPSTFFIDEAQFLNQEQALAFFLALDLKHTFNFYGLKNNWKGEMWEATRIIFNNADDIIRVPSYCGICKERHANWNKKIDTAIKEDVAIGFGFKGACDVCFYT